MLFFSVAMELFNAVSELACDVAHSHMLRYSRWNPNRLWVPTEHGFIQLANKLKLVRDKADEYGIEFVDVWN